MRIISATVAIIGTYEHRDGVIAAEFSDDDELRLLELQFDGRDLDDEAFAALCAAEGTTPRLVLDTLRSAAIDAAAEWPADADPPSPELTDADLEALAREFAATGVAA